MNDNSPDISKNVPLILDIDGSLLLTDLLRENLWAALAKRFFRHGMGCFNHDLASCSP